MKYVLRRYLSAFDALGFRVLSAVIDGWWPVVLLVPSMLLAVSRG